MKKIKEFLKNIFLSDPTKDYDFLLADSTTSSNEENGTHYINQNSNYDFTTLDDVKNIFPSIEVNLEYVRVKYNTLISSDVVIREFDLTARNRHYKAFLLFIDGLSDTDLINNYVLKPLMLKNQANTFDGEQTRILSEAVTNNITVRKVKKFDIVEYISSCLLPQNSLKQQSEFSEIFSGVNSGNCALFVDTLNIAFDIDVKGFKQRSIDSPNNEIVIRGPQEAFVENIRTNTSLIRRIVNTENLVIENIRVGDISKTNCAICYLADIANNDLVAEVKYRINNLGIDSLLSSGQLEQLIEETNKYSIPQILSTERPDKVTKYLFQGRVAVIVNGNPYCLVMPATLVDFISSPEDTNLKFQFANFLKFLRLLAMGITLLLPALYVAMTNFHQELIPTELLFSMIASRENVPFPMIFEILVMELSFELIREAGLRVPSPLGPTIGIVGALVLGQAAVSASIVSPILIIVVAITGIASFAIPDFSFGFHLRLLRFVFLALAYLSGFLGIGIGLFVYITILCSLKSFGVPYMVPFAPITNSKGNGYFVSPIWMREKRPDYLNAKKTDNQKHISMEWRYRKE